MPFPIIKLAYLAVKQISKPLANAIKVKAKTTPFLRNKILLPPAQLYHKFDTSIKMKLLGLGKVSDVKPLNEDIAVDLAADMLGEMIIFSIAAGMLLLEYTRQVWKDMSKEDVQNKRLKSLETEICNLNCRMDEQSKKMQEMGRALGIKFEDEIQKNTDIDVPTKIVDVKSNTVRNVTKT